MMYRIVIPGNVSMVFSILIPIVMFDILDSEYTTELFLVFDYESEDEAAESSMLS